MAIKKDSFVKGTLITYISILVIKVLGCLYVIPLYAIIGEKGGTLYNYAYQIYNLLLNITTAGIPTALCIILSEYNSLNMFKTKKKSFEVANKLIFGISITIFTLIFIFAGQIGSFFVSNIEGTTSINELKIVIRSVSLCLLVIPFLSVLRGYFQAHKYVTYSSISQVIEQIVRIVVVLLGAYITIIVFKKNVVYGVSIALLGALVGGIVAYCYLTIKRKKIKELQNEEMIEEEVVPSSKSLVKKILSFSIPMILITVINDLYNIVDIKLIIIGLSKIGYEPYTSEVIASIISTWAPKICVLITAIAMGMIVNIIPHMVNHYVKKEYDQVNNKISLALKTVLIIAIPTTIGIAFLSKYIYFLFYGESAYGGLLLIFSAIVNFIYCLYVVLNSILQSMKKFTKVYKNAIIGLLINAILDIPIILLLNKFGFTPYVGTSCASIIGLSISIVLSINDLKKIVGYKVSTISKYTAKLIVSNILMVIVLVIMHFLLPLSLEYGYLKMLIYLFVYVLISVIIYFVSTYKFGLLNEVFGYDIIDKLKNKVRRK